ncbi:MAG: UDP-N-acetylmuramoyl-L-alanine--D-glutamate ligase [Burkholderiaceae bacterium]|nr:UDP-N-acetylmuramoyl-L-alanine--D-glutamate ligase [Burkholderiaceae bacterium]MCD6675232.1 UDP-N-acetylmuramoyl-L-alanine--D-glutamate ligase [Burkholderiaceae bacterium]
MSGSTLPQPGLFDVAGRTALVLGLGDSGAAMARWLARQGARVRVADTRSADGTGLPAWPALRDSIADLRYVGGAPWSDAWLDGVDLVAWSPGLSIEQGAPAQFHARALARGVAVAGELELFAQALADLRENGYAPKLIAITGTNGKTTTTALAAHLCREAGVDVASAGNIRPPMLDALREALDAGRLPAVWVLELSSFQLALARSLAPDAAAIVNVDEDHLDWHASMRSYVEAKQRIYAHAKLAVFDRGDARAAPSAPGPALKLVSFGADAPAGAGDFGIVREHGIDWLAHAQPEEDPSAGASSRRRRVPAGFHVRRLMPADALRIRGTHNHLNALAALALCDAIGVPMAKMLHGLRSYAGEPHRCQLVATLDGVEYYDDSKGTNVGATVAALRGLGKRCRLIAGGDGKGQDFSALVEPVRAHAASVYLIGVDAPRLQQALAASGVPIVRCDSLEEAVRRAHDDAREGEAVLLSPACASLDMFRNYEHRGRCFVQAVRALDPSEAAAGETTGGAAGEAAHDRAGESPC